MTTETERDRALRRAERALDAERAAFATATLAAFTRRTAGPHGYDAQALVQLGDDLRPLFDALYGRFPGDLDRATIGVLTLDQSDQARADAARLARRTRP